MSRRLVILVALVFLGGGYVYAKEKPPRAAGQKIYKSFWSKSLKTGGKKRYFPDVASPVYKDGRVFAGTHSGMLTAIDSSSGRVIWSTETGGPIAAAALAINDLVVVGNNKGFVSAFDAATGRGVWQTYVGGEILSAPTSNGQTVFVSTSSREIFALDAGNGSMVWSKFIKGYDTKFTMRGNTSLVVQGGRLLAGYADGQVIALSTTDGSPAWSQNLSTGQEPFRDIDANLIVDGASLYAVGYFGYLVKMSSGDGNIVWKREARSGADMAFDGNFLVVSTTDGHLIAFDKDNGQRQWDIPLNAGVLSSPYIQDNNVIVGGREGQVFVVALSDGKVLQTLPMGSGYMGQGVAGANGFLILSSTGRNVSYGAR